MLIDFVYLDLMLTLGSYNITASFFTDPKDPDDVKNNYPHHWIKRRKYFPQALGEVNCDCMALQELSPEQAIDFFEMFPGHKFVFFVQAQTTEVESGQILDSADQIKQNLLGKNIGTPLIGIMWNPQTLKDNFRGMFWYNPEPFQRPTSTDRALTDKGFGNMNTPRGPGYIKFTHIESNKDFYFFTSHAPISGGSQTRIRCFETENKVIKEMVGSVPFFSVGDRNLLPDADVEQAYNQLVSLDHGVNDWLNPGNHLGFTGTWLGYLYEPLKFQNQINPDGSMTDQSRLDVGTSSLKSLWSAHYHCIIRNDDTVKLLGALNPQDNQTRNFLSDHSMVIAKFCL